MIKEIKKELIKLADSKYRDFSTKLNPGTKNILGVKLPILRKIANKICKQNPQEFLLQNDNEFMELTLIEAMIIEKLPNQEVYIENFIPKITNWAICDTFCAGLKCFNNNQNKELLEKYFNSDKEFELRFAYVVLMKFIENDYNYVIKKLTKFNNETYYAKMAAAWCLSFCIIKNFDQTLNDIQNLKFHPWVLKKGITKAIESLRLDKKQKDLLKTIRKNINFY